MLGDFQNFNPHLHIIATDGCFYGNGMFIKGPQPVAKDLEDALKIGEKQLISLYPRNFSSIRQVLFLPRETAHVTAYNIKYLLKLDIQSNC